VGRDGIISRIAVARDDAVVAIKRRLVVGEVGLAADDQALVLQKVDDGVALGRGGVGPLVELLGHVDEDDGRGHPDVEVGVVGEEEACQAKGCRRLANLVDVVAHLAIGDCPRELVVSLRRRIASVSGRFASQRCPEALLRSMRSPPLTAARAGAGAGAGDPGDPGEEVGAVVFAWATTTRFAFCWEDGRGQVLRSGWLEMIQTPRCGNCRC
jgi:hypothetical protein